jgi:hypothetical protein
MSSPAEMPPYDIVTIEDASNAVVKRLRVYVAVRPEHAGDMARIAGDVVETHAANNDVVIMFFHHSAAAAGKAPAAARAQYVRDGMKQGYVPASLKSDRAVITVRMPHGVMAVESARETGEAVDAPVDEAIESAS